MYYTILIILVLAYIQRVFTLAKDSEDHFVELVGKQSRKDTEKSVKKAKMECAKAENRIRQIDDIIAQIYEDKVSGELSSERFAKMLGKYEQEQNELTAKLDELRPMLEQVEEETQSTDRFLRLVKTHTEIEILTAEVVNEFIERIEVGETVILETRRFRHWKDEKCQNIKIVHNYIVTVPQEGQTETTVTREKRIATM